MNLNELWNTMEIIRFPQMVQRKAKLISFHRTQYEEISQEFRMPWYVVGLIHYRESDLNFRTHLHNGDPLTGPTIHVPAGRPPGRGPFSFIESAIDALYMKKSRMPNDWTIEATLEFLERYNGFGYRNLRKSPSGDIRPSTDPTWTPAPIPSPYLWSYSNHYTKGKFVADGRYSPIAIDQQIGCAPLLKFLDTTR